MQHTDGYRSATHGRSAEMAVRGGDDLRHRRNVGAGAFAFPGEILWQRPGASHQMNRRKLRNSGPQPSASGDTSADAKRKKKEKRETATVGSRAPVLNVLPNPMTPDTVLADVGIHPVLALKITGYKDTLCRLTSGPWRPGGVD